MNHGTLINPQFRLASEADAELLLQFMREYYAFDGHVFNESRARTALLTFLRDASFGWAWLICDHEIAIGYIVLTLGYSLEYQGRDAFIDEFFLRESYRGRGWGRQAVKFVEQFAGSHAVRAIHLEVVQSNSKAHAIYRRLGFQPHEHHLMTKWIGIDPSG